MDQYEWDDAKNAANRRKHGVAFEVVWSIDWTKAVIEVDDRFDYGEERARAFVRTPGQALCIAFTMRGDVMRIISIRRVHDKEARQYAI